MYIFEEIVITDPTEKAYKYLSECYNILEMHDDEVLVLEEAVTTDLKDPSYFYFKLANAYHLIKDYKNSLNSYLEVLNLNKSYINESFLNIANVSVELELFSSAIDNYTKYLELEPKTKQKRKIIKMIFLLKRAHKKQVVEQEEEKLAEAEAEKLELESRLASELEANKVDEERLNRLLKEQQLEEDRNKKAQLLDEERLLYDQEQKSLLEEQKKFEEAEEKVLNPPDPDIEAWRLQLQQKEAELDEREKRILEAEKRLREAEQAIEDSKLQDPFSDTSGLKDPANKQPDFDPNETEAEKLQREEDLKLERAILEEEIRQKILMDDILDSLDKIGENAQGLNASSESAYTELEGAGIDD